MLSEQARIDDATAWEFVSRWPTYEMVWDFKVAVNLSAGRDLNGKRWVVALLRVLADDEVRAIYNACNLRLSRLV